MTEGPNASVMQPLWEEDRSGGPLGANGCGSTMVPYPQNLGENLHSTLSSSKKKDVPHKQQAKRQTVNLVRVFCAMGFRWKDSG